MNVAIVATTILMAACFGVSLYFHVELYVLAGLAALAAVLVVLRRPRLGLYAAFMLIPLEVAGRITPSVSSITWAKVMLALTLVALLGEMLLGRRRLVLPPGGAGLYIVFLIALLATGIWFNLGGTIWGVIAFVGQAFIVVLAVNLLPDDRAFENATIAILLGSIPVSIVGVLDFVFRRSVLGTVETQVYADASAGLFRVTSTFYDPNALGRYLAFAVVVTICAMRFKRLRPYRWPLGAVVALQAFVMLMTFSRGAALSLVATLLLLLLWDRGLGSRVAYLSALAGACVGIYLIAEPFLAVLAQRLTGGGSTLAVDVNRVAIYQLGLSAFWRSPLIGYGPDNVSEAIGQYATIALAPHSLYLETLLAVGIVGSVAFFAFVFIQLARGIAERGKDHSDQARVAVFALTVVLLTGVTLHGFKSNELWASLALLACVPGLGKQKAMSE